MHDWHDPQTARPRHRARPATKIISNKAVVHLYEVDIAWNVGIARYRGPLTSGRRDAAATHHMGGTCPASDCSWGRPRT